jgi:hypothetical protein
LNKPEVVAWLGFLYEAYSKHAWAFELVDMIHKLTLTSILVFLPDGWQLRGGMIICGSYTVSTRLRGVDARTQ